MSPDGFTLLGAARMDGAGDVELRCVNYYVSRRCGSLDKT
jgi:hypothetical protein